MKGTAVSGLSFVGRPLVSNGALHKYAKKTKRKGKKEKNTTIFF